MKIEKRKYERFEIELPARMEAFLHNRKQAFDLSTKNISASGAFLFTESPFLTGSHIRMTLTTKNKKIVEITGSQSLIECEGSVVRSTPRGVAICFNKNCQIMCLKGHF
jgi:hypothetical protein